jgi:peroxiredoxin
MTDAYSLSELPEGIPTPLDDGACDHLPGMRPPPVALPSTSDELVDLSSLPGITVVYGYPRTGRPDENLLRGWDEIPGACGCTPQSRTFRVHHAEMRGLGARVFGLSTQDTGYQQEAVERLHLPSELLSDKSLTFAKALGLTTFEIEGMVLIKRLTIVIRDGQIEKVFYPVFPPGENASEVVEWLSRTTV